VSAFESHAEVFAPFPQRVEVTRKPHGISVPAPSQAAFAAGIYLHFSFSQNDLLLENKKGHPRKGALGYTA
jgi:hypothetical protein